jgi:hypothetical protein
MERNSVKGVHYLPEVTGLTWLADFQTCSPGQNPILYPMMFEILSKQSFLSPSSTTQGHTHILIM